MAKINLNVDLPARIGMPPDKSNAEGNPLLGNYDMRELLLQVKIKPRKITATFGDIYQFQSVPAHVEYFDLLKNAFGVGSQSLAEGLNVYALNEGSINDGISNNYGPSFIGSSLSWYNSSTIPELFRLGVIDKAGSKLSAMIPDEMVQGAVDEWSKLKAKLGNVGKIGAALGQGLRIDLPNIWQGSGSNISYSITVRLYNYAYDDDKAYYQQILAPIVAFMAMACPVTDDGVSYNRPFIASVDCPGLFKLKEAAITSVSITKGGDNNDISFHQHANSVDVRISFESLYPTMVVNSTGHLTIGTDETGPPSLNEYIENMIQYKTISAKKSSLLGEVIEFGGQTDVEQEEVNKPRSTQEDKDTHSQLTSQAATNLTTARTQ